MVESNVASPGRVVGSAAGEGAKSAGDVTGAGVTGAWVCGRSPRGLVHTTPSWSVSVSLRWSYVYVPAVSTVARPQPPPSGYVATRRSPETVAVPRAVKRFTGSFLHAGPLAYPSSK